MQIEKRIGREKKRCGYAPFNSAQQAIKLRSLRSLRPSGKLPSATCFIAGPLAAMHLDTMKISDRATWTVLIYLVSLCVIAPLTFLSWLIAFGHDEGTMYEPLGIIGYYSFYVFRFPTHNFLTLDNDGDFFFGLIINVFINSALATFIVIGIGTWRGKFKTSKDVHSR